jgi:hypothetical protein
MGDLVLDGVVCVVDCRNVLKVRGILHAHVGRGERGAEVRIYS